MKIWLYELYWNCRLISAYAKLQKAKSPERMRQAKQDVVLSLTRLGKHDFAMAEFAYYVSMKFAEENGDVTGWI